jgi:hypothetical protein
MSPDDIANYIGRVADLDLIEIEYVRTAANELEQQNRQQGRIRDRADHRRPPRAAASAIRANRLSEIKKKGPRLDA